MAGAARVQPEVADEPTTAVALRDACVGWPAAVVRRAVERAFAGSAAPGLEGGLAALVAAWLTDAMPDAPPPLEPAVVTEIWRQLQVGRQ